MRRMFGIMISPDSLAAFSASATSGLSAPRGPAPASAAIRLAGGAVPPRPKSAAPVPTAVPAPGQVLPRGSLLDLRV